MQFILEYSQDEEDPPCKNAKWVKICRDETLIGDMMKYLYLPNEDHDRVETYPISEKVLDGANGAGTPIYKALFEQYLWVVEINTLEELMELVNEVGTFEIGDGQINLKYDY